ncbi:hypothetical protein JGU71_02335 [Antrihabitans sp. YC3-6]|uniref:Uncharacterized protein n=1 Tax=Antrihabitans stalagmiti TaxID=2799499 RepID=A0A934NM43_9NOCA|nr:hypothetical protein [Antrihabitans stalagmiti]MBJ8337715.1 hypothetical protein [Antrihabitans stalagmiti]
MDKQVAGRLADEQLDAWQRGTTYAELAYADDNSSTTTRELVADSVTYAITSTVYREQGQQAYTMSVRVTVAGKKSLFGSAVSRHGRMFPDGRFAPGA